MALYSSNGVRRVLRVNPMATDPNSAVMITEASLPNAGQFGWTSRDLSGVKDLAVWVSEAQEAAESAQEQAVFAAESLKYIQAQVAVIDKQVTETNTQITTLSGMITNTQKVIDGFTTQYTDFGVKYADFLIKYKDFIDKYAEWKRSEFPEDPDPESNK